MKIKALVRKGANTSELAKLPVELVTGDVTELEGVTRGMAGCKQVYHLASLVPGANRDVDEFSRVNFGGTRNVLDAAVANGVERFLYVSTVNVLGSKPGATLDEQWRPEHSLHPGYDRSKADAEALVREYSKGPLNTVTVNPATMFGPGRQRSSKILEKFVTGGLRVIPDPGRPLSLIYIPDAALGCIKAMEAGAGGERYILCNPPITVREFINRLGKIADVKPPSISVPKWFVAIIVATGWVLSPITRRTPPVTVKGVWYGGTIYDANRSILELGMSYTELDRALEATVAWIRSEDGSRN
jgi:nucleoside-diphosphate-sugar epimerase